MYHYRIQKNAIKSVQIACDFEKRAGCPLYSVLLPEALCHLDKMSDSNGGLLNVVTSIFKMFSLQKQPAKRQFVNFANYIFEMLHFFLPFSRRHTRTFTVLVFVFVWNVCQW